MFYVNSVLTGCVCTMHAPVQFLCAIQHLPVPISAILLFKMALHIWWKLNYHVPELPCTRIICSKFNHWRNFLLLCLIGLIAEIEHSLSAVFLHPVYELCICVQYMHLCIHVNRVEIACLWQWKIVIENNGINCFHWFCVAIVIMALVPVAAGRWLFFVVVVADATEIILFFLEHEWIVLFFCFLYWSICCS